MRRTTWVLWPPRPTACFGPPRKVETGLSKVVCLEPARRDGSRHRDCDTDERMVNMVVFEIAAYMRAED